MMSTSPVILITGASSGIGEATARLFGMRGYRVVLAARRMDRLQTLAEEIQSSGGTALPIQTDTSRLEDISNLVTKTLETFGQIDVLFNNAGFGRLDWLEKLHPISDVQAQVSVNLLGVIWLAQAVLPHMIERRKGHIINMASSAGWIATPTYSVYAATKFAVRGFSEALRREVGVFNIHVSGVYPGGVRTEFEEHAHIKRKTGIKSPEVIVLNADDVANAVWRLVLHPRRGIVIPWILSVASWANTFFPGLLDWVMEKRFVIPERIK